MNRFTRTIKNIKSNEINLVGNKCYSLKRLLDAGVKVPAGFCITTEAFTHTLNVSGFNRIIQDTFGEFSRKHYKKIDEIANKIQEQFDSVKIPNSVEKDINEAYDNLNITNRDHEHVFVSIRSSATAEDLHKDSFAGLYLSVLNIKGIDNILQAIKKVWLSLYTKQAIYYYLYKGYDISKTEMAVIIQHLVPANCSGVLFTSSISGKKDEMLINSIWGLGEPLVSGKLNSDYFQINKNNFKIINAHVEEKSYSLICNPSGGVKTTSVPKKERKRQSLTNDQIIILARIGGNLEKYFEYELNIEWTFLNNDFYFLQARPITTLHSTNPLPPFPIKWQNEKDKNIIWTRGNGVPARFVDPVSPLSFDLVKIILANCWDEAMGRLPLPNGVMNVEFRLFNYYLYWNIDLDQPPKLSPKFLVFLYKLFISLRTGIEEWKEYLPTYLSKLNELKKVKLDNASLNDLNNQLHNIMNLFYEYFVWEVYLGETVDAFFGIFLDVVSKLSGESKLLVSKLVQGVDSRTQEMTKKLWQLVRAAKQNNHIKDFIMSEQGVEKIINNDIPKEFFPFKEEYNQFLKEYGHRSPKADWFFPNWNDDPSPIIKYIKDHLEIGEINEENIFEKRINEQQKIKSYIYKSIKKNPFKRPIFNWFIKTATRWTPMREDRQHYVKYSSQLLRNTLKEIENRYIKLGLLTETNEIFFLTLDEIQDIIKSRVTLDKSKIQNKIKTRKNKWSNCFELIPPPRITGIKDKNHVVTNKRTIKGNPVSSGIVIGIARVIKNLRDANNFSYGEILVTPETGPEWIVLFSLAKAIVTDYGMPLSHSALLAREFGIPGVSGTKVATGIIHTGDKILVDGDSGIVTLV